MRASGLRTRPTWLAGERSTDAVNNRVGAEHPPYFFDGSDKPVSGWCIKMHPTHLFDGYSFGGSSVVSSSKSFSGEVKLW